jgi:hypothetical protein
LLKHFFIIKRAEPVRCNKEGQILWPTPYLRATTTAIPKPSFFQQSRTTAAPTIELQVIKD